MAMRVPIARAALQFRSYASAKSVVRPSLSCRQWQQRPLQRSRLFSASTSVQDKKYTEDHEWIEVSPDGKSFTLGITKYAANALGDIVYIELPPADLEVSAGDAIGAVESVKSASDILTPVGGVVMEANSVLEDKPSTVNKDPEGEGWIVKFKEAKDLDEATLMNAEEYAKFTEG